MIDETNPQDNRSEEERREANRPDLGGPSWHESMQQRQQEYNERRREYEARLIATLLSAIQRGVIPDVWNLPGRVGMSGDDERCLFLLELAELSQGQRMDAPSNTAMAFSDNELRTAWRRIQGNIEEAHRTAWRRVYAAAVESGRLPSLETTDPRLFRRYSIAFSDLPSLSPISEYEKVWEKLETEWETTQQARGIDAEPTSSKANADNPVPKVRTERQRILLSIIYWATTRKNPRVLQWVACEKTGVKQRTYQQKKKRPEMFLSDAQIQEMGTTFEELWDVVAGDGDIEDVLETDF